MKFERLITNMIQGAGIVGAKKAEEAIGKLLGEADEPWKRAILEMTGDAVEEYGWEGVTRVQEAVDQLVAGLVPDMSFASLRARSDVLAFLQNAEAEKKKEARDFLLVVGSVIGVLLKIVIKALLRG